MIRNGETNRSSDEFLRENMMSVAITTRTPIRTEGVDKCFVVLKSFINDLVKIRVRDGMRLFRKIKEARYASNPLTHLDFLLFNKMDKKPIMAIEIDGTRYHAEGSRQAERDALKNSVMEKCGIPLLRLRTNESGEEKRIIEKLQSLLS